MNKIYQKMLGMALLTGLAATAAFAGNPDRQGEAGASQLLINPWARSAGLHSINTASITGSEAMFLNVAGLGRINKTQLQVGHTRYLDGADMGINALGFAQKVGNGAFGIHLMAMDLGDFEFTTTANPEGSGATFSPSFFNLGLSYSHVFANKVSVGVTGKLINESVTSVAARAFAIDAGVQYVTGPQDNFKFGISLRNVGSKMSFSGEGLAKPLASPNPTFPYQTQYYERSATYELPSQLNIGASYDWVLGKKSRLSVLGNFTSNAFSRDQVGAGVEFKLNDNFSIRGGYKYELDADEIQGSLDNGIAGGFSFSVPVKKGSDTRIGIDYGFRSTNIYRGIHNLGLRIDL
jgi:opacity protein-like surface antigen